MHATLFTNVKTASSRSFKLRMADGKPRRGKRQKWRENYDHVVVFPPLHGSLTVLLFYRKSKENQEISHISDFIEFICFPL